MPLRRSNKGGPSFLECGMGMIIPFRELRCCETRKSAPAQEIGVMLMAVKTAKGNLG
jgi:hypothetical protein